MSACLAFGSPAPSPSPSALSLLPTAAALPPPATAPFPCEDTARYYAGTELLSGPELKTALYSIVNGHKTYTYTQAWEALKVLDAADEKNPDASVDIIEIYTRKPAPKASAATPEGWNREHLWPRSYGLTQGKPEFSDLHNLRPSDVNVNSARGNKWYGECAGDGSDACLVPANREAAPDTATNKTVWTPPSEVRGDIARALMYMAVRYEGKEEGSFDLELTDSPSVAEARMGLLSSLLKWHEADPPSASERLRNDRVCSLYQHNRNPFVDHPEFAARIWPASAPGASSSSSPLGGLQLAGAGGGLPAAAGAAAAGLAAGTGSAPTVASAVAPQAWVNEIHYSNDGQDQAEFIEIVASTSLDLDNTIVYLYNGADGGVYDKYRLSEFSLGQTGKNYQVLALMLPPSSLQNGPSDGVAVVREPPKKPVAGGKPGATFGTVPPATKPEVLDFVTYEGGLVANTGPAAGRKSLDVGVEENDKAPLAGSIGMTGKWKGSSAGFIWKPFPQSTFGRLNAGQEWPL